jgi:hypothetical protein
MKDQMIINEFLAKIRDAKLNQPEAIAMAGMFIAAAIDRQTELQKISLEIQMKMSGSATDMFEKMSRSVDNMNEGDEWKNGRDDDDGYDSNTGSFEC